MINPRSEKDRAVRFFKAAHEFCRVQWDERKVISTEENEKI